MLTAADCADVTAALEDAISKLPANARAVRTLLKVTANEHKRANKDYGRAEDEEMDPEIRPVGGIGRGECVMTQAGVGEVRRVTETGVEVMIDGFPQWVNIAGRTTPLVTVAFNVEALR